MQIFGMSSKYLVFLLDWLHCFLFPCALFCSYSMNSLVIRLWKDLCRIGNSIRFFPDVSKPYGYSYHNMLQCKQSNIKLSTALTGIESLPLINRSSTASIVVCTKK